LVSVRALAQSRPIIAISPMAIGRPGSAPKADPCLYDSYLRQMARITSELLLRDNFLVFVTSCLDEDQPVITELLDLLDDDVKQRLIRQAHIPPIETWQEFVATVRGTDLLIASRLHSIILGFISGTPAIAISSAAKVDSVMADFGQSHYLFQTADFSSEDVLDASADLRLRRDAALQQISLHHQHILPVAASQYDTLALLAKSGV
jgi:polysaccharide pyruvyl transferase WcaK-like protein